MAWSVHEAQPTSVGSVPGNTKTLDVLQQADLAKQALRATEKHARF
ncbi:MAG: hypothetical protein AAF197_11310 [Pseudomonadota bacterium]